MARKDEQVMVGFWCPRDLADALTEEQWVARTNKSSILKQSLIEYLEKKQKEREQRE